MDDIEKVSVSLGKKEREIVQEVSESRALYNFSLALRQIVREWKDLQRVAITDKGRQVLSETPCSDHSARA